MKNIRLILTIVIVMLMSSCDALKMSTGYQQDVNVRSYNYNRMMYERDYQYYMDPYYYNNYYYINPYGDVVFRHNYNKRQPVRYDTSKRKPVNHVQKSKKRDNSKKRN